MVKFTSIPKLLDYLDDVKNCPRGQYLRMIRKQYQRMQARNGYIYAVLFLDFQVIGNQNRPWKWGKNVPNVIKAISVLKHNTIQLSSSSCASLPTGSRGKYCTDGK